MSVGLISYNVVTLFDRLHLDLDNFLNKYQYAATLERAVWVRAVNFTPLSLL